MTRVLITGAAGRIGTILRNGLYEHYELLRLADVSPIADLRSGEEAILTDVRDLDQCKRMTDGIDAVVHLAGTPDETTWEKIRDLNIEGTYNVFEASRQNNVGCVIFASSNMATGFYRRTAEIDSKALPRPSGLYGVSKAFGEAVGRMYADKFGLRVACLRIGSFRQRPEDERHLATWISYRDLIRLVRCCIDEQNYHYEIVYGVSDNKRSMWINDSAVRIGYAPQDKSEDYAEEIIAKNTIDPKVAEVLEQGGAAAEVISLFQGGYYCAMNFTGDPKSID